MFKPWKSAFTATVHLNLASKCLMFILGHNNYSKWTLLEQQLFARTPACSKNFITMSSLAQIQAWCRRTRVFLSWLFLLAFQGNEASLPGDMVTHCKFTICFVSAVSNLRFLHCQSPLIFQTGVLITLVIFYLLKIVVDADEIRRLGKRFRKLDLDKSGALSVEEFMSLPELQQNPLVQRVIDIFDTDGNGEVDFKG